MEIDNAPKEFFDELKKVNNDALKESGINLRKHPVIKGEDAKRFLKNEKEVDEKLNKIREYFRIINERLDNMTDEEIHKLLLEAGLEKCPYLEEDQLS